MIEHAWHFAGIFTVLLMVIAGILLDRSAARWNQARKRYVAAKNAVDYRVLEGVVQPKEKVDA